jgi:hypothetical protein
MRHGDIAVMFFNRDAIDFVSFHDPALLRQVQDRVFFWNSKIVDRFNQYLVNALGYDCPTFDDDAHEGIPR